MCGCLWSVSEEPLIVELRLSLMLILSFDMGGGIAR